MKKHLFWMLFVSLCSSSFVSCEKDEKEGDATSEGEKSKVCLVVNQGNYSEANGSLSVLYSDGSVENQVYKAANGFGVASTIESVADCGDCWALMCNAEDKVELVEKNTFKSVGTIKGVPTPRYAVVKDGFLYVTSSDFEDLSKNGLYKVDLSSKEVVESWLIEGLPEGIALYDDCVWVASSSYNSETWSSYDPAVTRFQLKNNMKRDSYKLEGEFLAARHLVVDKSGNIWISMANYGVDGAIAKVDTFAKTLSDKAVLPALNYPGHIYLSNSSDKIYYMTSDGYSSGSADEVTTIKTIDLKSRTIETLISGNGFYGFGVDESANTIYTANVNGFASNATMYVYTAAGDVKSDALVGVGACRFLKY